MIHRNFRCELFLIRHGESASNANPALFAGAGRDPPLTPRGLEQATLLGRRLQRDEVRFDRVYCSSLLRAVQTAETMLQVMGQPEGAVTKVDALIEVQSPVWRGVRLDEIRTTEALSYVLAKGAHFVPPQGESRRMVQRRAANWLEDEIIYNEALVANGGSLRVAIVGHHIATCCLLQYVMGFDERLIERIELDNCSISRLLFDKEGWHVLGLNDSSHLDGT